MLHAQEADLGQVGLGDLLLRVGYMGRRRKSGKGHFHVRLPGGKPHVAHQQVRTSKLGAAVDGEGEGTAGRLRFEPGLPETQTVCGGGDGLAVESDGDLLRRRGLAPQVDGRVALQDRVVGNDAGKPQFRSVRVYLPGRSLE